MRPLALLAALAAAIATPALAKPPELAPAPAQEVEEGSVAWLYGDCLSQAGEHKLIMRQGRYLQFTCWGEAAQAIYDRLQGGVARGSYLERKADLLTTRYLDADGQGGDSCWLDRSVPQGQLYGCTLVVPAGSVLDEPGPN